MTYFVLLYKNFVGGEGHSALDANFTLAQSTKTNLQMEGAVDIKIEKFSIAAKGKDLFTNASLLIAQVRQFHLCVGDKRCLYSLFIPGNNLALFGISSWKPVKKISLW